MRRRAAAAVVVLVLAAGGCRRGDADGNDGTAPASTTTTPVGSPVGGGAAVGEEEHPFDPAADVPGEARPRSGSARVGVWAAPDPDADTTGGAAVRSLVFPQLFVARPDGRWSSGLAAPGSDRTADDRRSATFRLRADASWSDGSPITVDDLRRSADERFVAGIDDPAEDGTITVRFVSELPGWRRLWSATDSIAPPRAGVFGGPFVVAAETPGLETVLHRNERWWGPNGPFLDEVRLVLVPDQITARQLLARGELDVVMPLAATVRTRQFGDIPDVDLDRTTLGGWTVALEVNPERLDLHRRCALIGLFDRAAFVRTLLAGEATLIDGFAGPGDTTWTGIGVGGEPDALEGRTVDLVGFAEEPMTTFVHRSMQKRVRTVDGSIELRAAEADRVEGWLRERDYDAAIVVRVDPLGRCWVCRWPDRAEARGAEAGDPASVAALEAAVRDEALALPLWDGTTVVATRAGLSGVAANGYALSAAWNAWEWWRPAG